MCGIYTSLGPAPHADLAFNEGKRTIGLEIYADIGESDDRALLNMQREAKIRAEINSTPKKEKKTDA